MPAPDRWATRLFEAGCQLAEADPPSALGLFRTACRHGHRGSCFNAGVLLTRQHSSTGEEQIPHNTTGGDGELRRQCCGQTGNSVSTQTQSLTHTNTSELVDATPKSIHTDIKENINSEQSDSCVDSQVARNEEIIECFTKACVSE